MDNKKQYSNKDLRNILTDFVQMHTINVEINGGGCGMFEMMLGRMVTTLELNDNALERFFERAGCDVPPPTKMNTWYKGSNGSLFFAVEFSQTGNGMIEGYGFDAIGNFYELGVLSWFDKDLRPATEEEVLNVMIAECVRLGLVFGQNAECRGVAGGMETINGCNYHMTNFNSTPMLWVKSIRNGASDEIQLFRSGKFADKA